MNQAAADVFSSLWRPVVSLLKLVEENKLVTMVRKELDVPQDV